MMTDITEKGIGSEKEFRPEKPKVVTLETYNNGYVK